jgi:hypothetical protein
MANTYTLISSNVLTSSAASVTFSAIPATYTDLVLRASVRGDDTSYQSPFRIKINADTGSNYSRTRMYGIGSSAVSNRASNESDNIDVSFFNQSTSTSNTFANIEVYVPSYLSTVAKPISGTGALENNSTTEWIRSVHAVLYRGTSAITSLEFFTNAGSFVSGSSFYLYGISNA